MRAVSIPIPICFHDATIQSVLGEVSHVYQIFTLPFFYSLFRVVILWLILIICDGMEPTRTSLKSANMTQQAKLSTVSFRPHVHGLWCVM